MSSPVIPPEILHLICSQLDRADLKAFRECNKLFEEVATAHLARDLRLSIQEPAFTNTFFLAASKRIAPEVQQLEIDISRSFDYTVLESSTGGLPPLPLPAGARCAVNVINVKPMKGSSKRNRRDTSNPEPLTEFDATKIQCGFSMIFKQLQSMRHVTISTQAHSRIFPSGYIFKLEPRTRRLVQWILENMANPQQSRIETLEIRTGRRPQLNLNDFAPYAILAPQMDETKTVRSAFKGLKSFIISTYIGPPTPESFSWLSYGLKEAAPTLESLHIDFTFDMNGESRAFAVGACVYHSSQDVPINCSTTWELLGLNVLFFPRLRTVLLKNVAHHLNYPCQINSFLRRHNQVGFLKKVTISSWSCETGLADFPSAEAVSMMTNQVDIGDGLLDKVILQRDFNTHERNCKTAPMRDITRMAYWIVSLGELDRRYRGEGRSKCGLYNQFSYEIPFPLTERIRQTDNDRVHQIVMDHVREKKSREMTLRY